MSVRKIPCALTIAGTDSSGGAGIAADLKTFAALAIHGAMAVTAVTVQDTSGVYEIMPVPREVVKNQIEVILNDLRVKAAKTGMLFSKEIIETVAEIVRRRKMKLVVDPVLKAASGDPLSRDEATEAYMKSLIPVAFAVTPNVPEAEVLTAIRIKGFEDMKKAARKLQILGPKIVVIKGGHMDGEDVVDVALVHGEFLFFKKHREPIAIHGGGCSYSAALAAYLAKGINPVYAVKSTEKFIGTAIKHSAKLGKGRSLVNPLTQLYIDAEKYEVLKEVSEAVKKLEAHQELADLIPEVGMQVAMATQFATETGDVAAVDGRILRQAEGPRASGPVDFGVSSHVARIVLAAMKIDPSKRAAVNIRYSTELLGAFTGINLKIANFDRGQEPKAVKETEAGTLGWAVAEAAERTGIIPDVIYDLGEVGKEPMIRLIGTSARQLISMIIKAKKSTRRKSNGS